MTKKEAMGYIETALTSLDNVSGCLDQVEAHLVDEEGATSKNSNFVGSVIEDVNDVERLIELLKEKVSKGLKN